MTKNDIAMIIFLLFTNISYIIYKIETKLIKEIEKLNERK